MWQYRWLVLGVMVAVTGLGYLYGSGRPPAFEATASIVVEDPSATGLFDSPTVSPERYVTDQLAILESGLVAERAAQLTREELPGSGVDPQTILDNIEVQGGPQSDVIDVGFIAPDREVAQVVTNSIVTAYQEVRRTEAVSTSGAALETVDMSLQTLDQELASIQSEITTLRQQESFRPELEQQVEAAIARLLELWQQRAATSDPVALATIDDRIDAATNEIQTIGLVEGVRGQDSESVLLQERQAVLDRRNQLEQRRDQMIVDAELTSGGVVVLSPAQPGTSTGPGLSRILAVAAVLGVLAGAGLAYLLAQRRRTFAGRTEPESVLGAPLLAEVPVFSEEGIKSKLPVATDRFSASAESFRFAATAIHIQGDHLKTLVAVSSTLGEGKTTVVANTAFAATREGNSVLLIDADFGDQSLSRLLLNGREVERGLTELVEDGLEPIDVLEVIAQMPGAELGLIGRGKRPVTAPDFFSSAGAQDFFRKTREMFDLVLIDAPPLLQVAYASIVARYADAAVVVVPHESDVGDLEEITSRLFYIGIPAAGYIYNFAPLRPEMIASKKSMKNTLGTTEEVRRGRARHS